MARQRDLGAVRAAELLKNGFALGIDEQEIWDHPDGGVPEVPLDELVARVESALRRFTPDLVVELLARERRHRPPGSHAHRARDGDRGEAPRRGGRGAALARVRAHAAPRARAPRRRARPPRRGGHARRDAPHARRESAPSCAAGRSTPRSATSCARPTACPRECSTGSGTRSCTRSSSSPDEARRARRVRVPRPARLAALRRGAGAGAARGGRRGRGARVSARAARGRAASTRASSSPIARSRRASKPCTARARFDAVLAHNAEAALVALALRARLRLPVVYVAHTLWAEEMGDVAAACPGVARAAGVALDRALARVADAVLALTEPARRALAPFARGPVAHRAARPRAGAAPGAGRDRRRVRAPRPRARRLRALRGQPRPLPGPRRARRRAARSASP